MTERQSKSPKIDAPFPASAASSMFPMVPWAIGAQMPLTMLEGATRIQGEWARFLAERLTKDAEIQHQLFNCTSPTDAQQIGANFVHDIVSDYLTETARITAMGSQVSQGAGLDV
ncbi:hypothetical protein SAMN05444004_11342 [Jannaschia faecimaris]|uniref:Phasin protein n=1 Tax=Jannaschia faecimaris TaxID=1244108 RepID=A0A1H3SRM9_9RHOB|nr:hypothetical protein [Jannaschia faecimaris]SDZ40370.1 hypothetical protein SAMN05444004_11342 [Jannaschia faecimaris]